MKIIRYLDTEGQILFGEMTPDGAVQELEGQLFGAFRSTGRPAQIRKQLAPLVPYAILCIGLNYRKHAEETGANIPEDPVLFMKAPSALQNPGDPIQIPQGLPSTEVDYEAELAVVIGRTCKNVKRAQALEYVYGYSCGNDVSARDWQKKRGGSQWCRGKTFDTFAPLGPCLVTADEIPNPNRLQLSSRVNGEVRQQSSTSDMIFDVPTLIEFLSGSTTLWPGTVIFTGTPSGVGMAFQPPKWLQPGDEVTVEIEGIGRLTNPVEAEKT